MKKICLALATTLLLAACGNDAATTDTVSDSATTIQGVENVNGNIPDTAATGAEPNAHMHTDSAQ